MSILSNESFTKCHKFFYCLKKQSKSKKTLIHKLSSRNNLALDNFFLKCGGMILLNFNFEDVYSQYVKQDLNKKLYPRAKSNVSFFVQCIKKQLIALQNFNTQTCFRQFLWFSCLEYWFKGQIIYRIHPILPNAYKLMCFDRNINGNRDVEFLEWDYLLLQQCMKITS